MMASAGKSGAGGDPAPAIAKAYFFPAQAPHLALDAPHLALQAPHLDLPAAHFGLPAPHLPAVVFEPHFALQPAAIA